MNNFLTPSDIDKLTHFDKLDARDLLKYYNQVKSCSACRRIYGYDMRKDLKSPSQENGSCPNCHYIQLKARREQKALKKNSRRKPLPYGGAALD